MGRSSVAAEPITPPDGGPAQAVERVLRAGRRSSFTSERLGADRYALLEAAWDGDYLVALRPRREKRK